METEHLLYGFTTLRDGTSVALEKNKVSTSAAQTALRAMHGGDGGAGGGGGLSGMFGKQAKAANTAEMLPFAPTVDAAFQAANKAAKAEEDGKVNSRVLLLALLKDEDADSGAMRMLANMGVDPVQLETDLSPRAQVYMAAEVGVNARAQSQQHTSYDCNLPPTAPMAPVDTLWLYRPHQSLSTTINPSRFPRSRARRRGEE